MAKFIFKRLITIILTVWVVVTITFIMMHAVPGGPFSTKKKIPPVIKEAMENKYHLHDPLIKQYFDYIGNVMHMDLGPSFKWEGMTVNDFIEKGFPISAKLGILAIALSLAVGVPFGIISAIKSQMWQDHAITIMATLGVCIPSFVFANVLIYAFGLKLNWLPIYGLNSIRSYILPVVGLAIADIAFLSRLVRSSILEVLEQDYVTTARAKGLPSFIVLYKHVLRNALIPVVSFMGPMISGILTGSYVIEKIFVIPGMGQYFIQAISNRDYTVIMGITIFTTFLMVFCVMASDVLYGVVDPRIRIEGIQED